MKRKRMSDTIKELEQQVAMLHGALSQAQGKCDEYRYKLNCHERTERRFDQLMEGLCMGMKEGSLPRRTPS